jgi:hypothetical protein
MEYSVPKRLGKSKYYSQVIWDEENKQGYIGILTMKPDGTFERKSDDFTKDAMAKLAAAPTLQTPVKLG